MEKVPRERLHEMAEDAARHDTEKKATAKRYLQSIRRMEESIERKKVELEMLKEDACSLGSLRYDAVRVQTSMTGDKMSQDVSSYIDMEKDIEKEIENLGQARHTVIRQLEGLENPCYVSLLFKRYVEYKSLEQISVEMNFTYEYTRRMHGRALQEFERSYTKLHLPVVL